MSKNLLLIFTRNPELGKVKTRLAKKIGKESALEIYKILLQRTKEITLKVDSDKAVYYSEEVNHNFIWNEKVYQKHQQKGKDLGKRMRNAFIEGFNEGYNNIIIIGSDLFDLSTEIINNAFDKLQKNEVVIGPAKDGGYYLLGMKTLHPNIFENKAWGTDSVRQETLNDLKNNKVHLLETLNDIDVFEDIEHHSAFQSFIKQQNE